MPGENGNARDARENRSRWETARRYYKGSSGGALVMV
ncbi:hypothetical protein AOG2_20830 [Geobacter sp. AOG2]|nr:hypothetical protein AOG2_20830 [Geobacter sp. AOG2]